MQNENKMFKEAYDSVRAPEEMKAQTLAMMQKEKNRQEKMTEKQKSNRPLLFKVYRIAGIAAVACAAVLCFVIFRPTGAVYLTPMEEGSFYEEVELKDGTIKFVQNRVAISISPNAGQVVIGGGNTEKENKDDKKDAVLVKEEGEDGGILELKETNGISLPEIRQDSWSNIGEQEIYVTVLKTDETRYQAVYEKEGCAYEVVGSNVSQKAFIDFLYEQIK